MLRRTVMLECLLVSINSLYPNVICLVIACSQVCINRCETLAVFSANKMAAGRPERICVEIEEEILQHFLVNLRRSIRVTANWLRKANHSEVWWILRDNQLHTYHFQSVQALLRLTGCTLILEEGNWRRFFEMCALQRRSLFNAQWCAQHTQLTHVAERNPSPCASKLPPMQVQC